MIRNNITVHRMPVRELLRCVREGRFAIPKLQREFVWDGPKAAKLLDSINADMPIGVIMIWETARSHRLYLRTRYHVLPPFNARNGKVWFLIDGQQRVSVLHHVCMSTASVRSKSTPQTDAGRWPPGGWPPGTDNRFGGATGARSPLPSRGKSFGEYENAWFAQVV